MESVHGKDYAQFYSNLYHNALQEEKYDDALYAAMKGYVIANDMDDEECKHSFLNLVKSSIYDLIEEELNRRDKESEQGYRCIFCGKRSDEVKLMAGALGSICQNCATQVHEHFTQEI